MKIAYGKDQKINGKLQNDFDADYAFLERALEHSGDIVKNMFFTNSILIYLSLFIFCYKYYNIKLNIVQVFFVKFLENL